MDTNTWCVYRHTSPSGKVYTGITHYEDPSLRWGSNGTYYHKNTVFAAAIRKYGWNNITHEVLLDHQTEEAAKYAEVYLIRWYTLHNLSYNMTVGGDGHNFGKNSNSAEYRTKLSREFRKRVPDWDKQQYEKHKEARKQNAREYYRANREKVLAYKRTEEVRAKARERAKLWREKHLDYMKSYMKRYNQKQKIENE